MRLRVQRASATCDHRARSTPCSARALDLLPVGSVQIAPRQQLRASLAQTPPPPPAISTALGDLGCFLYKTGSGGLGVQSSRHLPGRPLPFPQPHVLTARPSLSGWGLCPWETRGRISVSPSTPPPVTGFPSGPRASPVLGFPSRGFAARSPSVRSSEQLLRAWLGRTHAGLRLHLPEEGVDTRGGWGGLCLGPCGLPGWHERPGSPSTSTGRNPASAWRREREMGGQAWGCPGPA